MARSSRPVKGSATRKPEQLVRPAAARAPKPGPSTKLARSAPRNEPDLAPEVGAASEMASESAPQVPEAEPLPEIAEPAPTPLEAVVAEALSDVAADVLASAPVETEALVDAGSGAEEEATAAATTVLHEVDRLRGMTIAFWQDHLERTMAAGQAIMTCPSPQAAMALQVSYLQASLASGIAHASRLARLSTEIARNIGPFRGR